VSDKKKVLIITDGTEIIDSIAHSLEQTLTGAGSFAASAVKICNAQEFSGTDLLPANTFFIGCEKPNPPSFEYLKDMLAHINFAGRSCGIFSVNKKTLNYLSGIIKDCEVKTGEPLLITEPDVKSVKNWLKGIMD